MCLSAFLSAYFLRIQNTTEFCRSTVGSSNGKLHSFIRSVFRSCFGRTQGSQLDSSNDLEQLESWLECLKSRSNEQVSKKTSLDANLKMAPTVSRE